MNTLNSIDIRIAIFLRKCFNYYIRKRTYLPPPTPLPSIEEIWESLFIDNSSYVYEIDQEINILLFKDSILCKNIFLGFEQVEIAFIKRYLKKGDIFFDIGANIGLYSLIASKILKEEGKVFAFEPTPLTFRRLNQNISLNKIANIEAYNIGLSNRKGTQDLFISTDGYDAWNSFALLDELKGAETIRVYVDTLDSFISANKINKVDFIKLDVEGWEKYVLQGAKELLINECAPVFMVEFTEYNAFAAGYYLGELYDFMKGFGFNWYSYNKEENFLVRENKKLHYPYENIFAIKNINECIARISE